MSICEILALELRINMNQHALRSFWRYLNSSKEVLDNSGLNGDLNPDVCDAGAVFGRLGYQAHWELVVMWVYYKPIDAGFKSIDILIHEIDVLGLQIDTNVYDPLSFKPIHEFHVLTSYGDKSISIICRLIINPHGDQVTVGPLARPVGHCTGITELRV